MHFKFAYISMPLCSTLTTVTRVAAAGPRNQCLVSVRRRDFSLLFEVQTTCSRVYWVQPALSLTLEQLDLEPVPQS